MPPAAAQTRNSVAFPGVIVGTPQEEFQLVLDYFVSSFMDPYDPVYGLGQVSGYENSSTGVQFGGMLSFLGGFNPDWGFDGSLDTSRSKLEILIWDSNANQSIDGQPAGGILMNRFKLVDYYITSQDQITLIFEDEYGVVQMEGYLDFDYFVGTISYSNKQYWDGQTPGAEGVIGEFSVSWYNV